MISSILCMTSIYPAERYYFLSSPIIFVILIVAVYRYLKQRQDLKNVRRLFIGICFVGVALLSYGRYDTFLGDNLNSFDINTRYVYMNLTKYLEEQSCTRIVGTFWHSHPIHLISNGKIASLAVHDNGIMFDWATDRSQYINDDEPITLILTTEEKEKWRKNEKTQAILSIAKEEHPFENYVIYRYEKNPFSFDCIRFGQKSRFNILTLPFNEKARCERGMIAVAPGGVQFGPYAKFPPGEYKVTIRGENLVDGDFDAGCFAPKVEPEIFVMENTSKNATEVQYTLHLDATKEQVELRCFNHSPRTVFIQDIAVEPIGIKPIWERHWGGF